MLCKTTSPKLVLQTVDSKDAHVEFKGLEKSVLNQGLMGFKIYFEIYSLDTLTPDSNNNTRPPRTTPNLLITAGTKLIYGLKIKKLKLI